MVIIANIYLVYTYEIDIIIIPFSQIGKQGLESLNHFSKIEGL